MTTEPGSVRPGHPAGGVPADVAARLLRALDRAPGAFVVLVDAEMRVRWVSRSASWVTGVDPGTRPGEDAFARVHPDDAKRLAHALAQLPSFAPSAGATITGPGPGPGAGTDTDTATGETGERNGAGDRGVAVIEPLRYRVRQSDGTWLTVEAQIHNLLHDPVVRGLVVIGRPMGGEVDGVGRIVDLLTADAPLPEVLAACAELVPHYLGSTAVVGLLDGQAIVGARPGSPAGRLSDDARWWAPTVVHGLARTSAGLGWLPADLAGRARSEGFRSVWVLPLVGPSAGGVLGCLVAWVRADVELNIATEHGLRQAARLATLVVGEQRRTDALERAAVTDPLTGVGNRSALRRRLDAEPGPVTMAILDLDDFKPVNDTHGHDVGDAVLREIAQRIAATVREDDLVVRFGGDEFAIVFADPEPADGSDADGDRRRALLRQRLVDAVAVPVELDDGATVTVGASVGVSTAAPSEVVRLADTALYEAKRQKRPTRGRKRRTRQRRILLAHG